MSLARFAWQIRQVLVYRDLSATVRKAFFRPGRPNGGILTRLRAFYGGGGAGVATDA